MDSIIKRDTSAEVESCFFFILLLGLSRTWRSAENQNVKEGTYFLIVSFVICKQSGIMSLTVSQFCASDAVNYGIPVRETPRLSLDYLLL